jgi:hypothetical protein
MASFPEGVKWGEQGALWGGFFAGERVHPLWVNQISCAKSALRRERYQFFWQEMEWQRSVV